VLAARERGERLDDAELAAMAEARQAPQSQIAGGVGVLPLYGTLFPRANLVTQMSGGTSLQQFQSAFRAMAADSSVGAIVLDVDSPGGMTDLVPEVAADIRAARSRKPVVAVANTDAASAAYWIASQASELVVTPSGMVGSIGVFAIHDDISRAQEQAGVTTSLVSAGKYKVEGNPFEPLTEEARGAIQSVVDEFYGMFVRDVARGRRTEVAAVRAGFGEGRMVTARHAVEQGMADRVDTIDNVIGGLLKQMRAGKQAAASTGTAAATNSTTVIQWGFADEDEPPPIGDAVNAETVSGDHLRRVKLSARARVAKATT
jgi:signal peptide peptidase SppA